jgi:hypothetical protein
VLLAVGRLFASCFSSGLSKFARLVELYSKRLQIQERLTAQIGESIQELCAAAGVAVYVDCSYVPLAGSSALAKLLKLFFPCHPVSLLQTYVYGHAWRGKAICYYCDDLVFG